VEVQLVRFVGWLQKLQNTFVLECSLHFSFGWPSVSIHSWNNRLRFSTLP
jgi:hypothetical protein